MILVVYSIILIYFFVVLVKLIIFVFLMDFMGWIGLLFLFLWLRLLIVYLLKDFSFYVIYLVKYKNNIFWLIYNWYYFIDRFWWLVV